MKVRIGHTEIILERGDITEYEVDAIVSAANTRSRMTNSLTFYSFSCLSYPS